jgi:hypothetical protein
MSNMERIILSGAARTYEVEKPDYLLDAEKFLAAAAKFRIEVETAEQPTLEGVTAKTISKKIDEIIAAGDHLERLTLAARVEVIANGDVEAAFDDFSNSPPSACDRTRKAVTSSLFVRGGGQPSARRSRI